MDERTPAETSDRRRGVDPWLVVTLVLAAALIGLSAWVLLDRQSQGSLGLASSEVMTMLKDRIAAMNRADGKTAAAFYDLNAVMMEMDLDPPLVTTGRGPIADRLQGLTGDAGLRMKPAGVSIEHDRYVAEPVSFSQEGGPGYGEGILVFEINHEGEIAKQWVIGWVNSP